MHAKGDEAPSPLVPRSLGWRLHAIRASDTNFFSGLVGFNFAPADVYFGRGQTILLEEKGPNAKPSNTGFTAKIAEKLA
jgi:hypothetical protein